MPLTVADGRFIQPRDGVPQNHVRPTMGRRRYSHQLRSPRDLRNRKRAVSAAAGQDAISRDPAGRVGFFQPLTVAASSRYRVPVVCAFLLLAVGLVFGQTVRYEFVNLDDNLSVYDDPQVRGGFSPQAVASAFLRATPVVGRR